MNPENQIAFKDFKNSVSTKEFETVLEIVKEEYTLVQRLLEKTSDFEKKSLKKLRKEMPDMQNSDAARAVLEKLTINLSQRAKTHLMDSFGTQIKRSKEVTDFLNRFQKSGEEYPELNTNFLNI